MASLFNPSVSAVVGLLLCVAAGHSTATVSEEGKYGVICVSDDEASFAIGVKCLDSISNCTSLECVEKATRGLSSFQTLFLVTEVRLDHSINFQNLQNISFVGSKNGTIINCSEAKMTEESGVGLTFTHVHNLQMVNMTFLQCSALHEIRTYDNVNAGIDMTLYKSAIHIVNSTNVRLVTISITRSPGSGLMFYDTGGLIEMIGCTLSYNGNESGGVYIEFTGCSRETHTTMGLLTNNSYRFINCNFSFNHASLGDRSKRSPVHRRREIDHSMGKGGAICIYMNDGVSDSKVEITDSRFRDNSADWGGALYVAIRGSSSDNSVTVTGSEFKRNQSPKKGGGAVGVSIESARIFSPRNNSIIFHTCYFTNNSAAFGGGTAIHASKRDKGSVLQNLIAFIQCIWKGNRGRYGSAVDLTPQIWDTLHSGQTIVTPTFRDCSFIGNKGVPQPYNYIKSTSWHSYQLPRGALAISAFTVKFAGSVKFINNNCSSVYLVSSIASFDAGTEAIFNRNEGLNGGAIALIGFSSIQVRENSIFHFIENKAMEKGGAIFVTSIDYHDYLSTRSCFLQYLGENWKPENVTFIFENNTAGIFERSMRNNGSWGNSIFATSVLSCFYACHGFEENHTMNAINTFDCIGNFHYNGSINLLDNEIGTEIYTFEVKNMPSIIPGRQFKLPFNGSNQYGREVDAVYQAHSMSSEIIVEEAYSYVYNRTMELYGRPESKGKLSLYQHGLKGLVISAEVQLEQCPPGYVLNDDELPECVCSYLTNTTYMGIVGCDKEGGYSALLAQSYWMGYDKQCCKGKCSQECLLTSYCPSGFCFANSNDVSHSLPGYADATALDDTVCGPGRTGTLCARCRDNHSVYYHHYSLSCMKNKLCHLGWLFYILSELLPITVLFVLVMVLNVNFTSGASNGFIFFAQIYNTLDITAQGSFIIHNEKAWNLTKMLEFVYKFFDLDFFNTTQMSFCLWQSAETLHILLFKYVTMAYAVFLILLTIILMNVIPFYRICHTITPRMARQSVIHGLTAFLVMCYSQCAKVTFKILNPTVLYAMNNERIRIVPFYDGENDYFGEDHSLYATPAVLCLIFILIIPPLMLIMYPATHKVLAFCKVNESALITKVAAYFAAKLKPVLDSFQSCFKDNMRFFAGLYFAYRLVILATSVFAASPVQLYTISSIVLILILLIQALAQPYRVKWHNVIDMFIFGSLAVISCLTLYNFTRILEARKKIAVYGVVSIQLAIAIIPLVYMTGYIIVTLLRSLCTKYKEQRMFHTSHNFELPARLMEDVSNSETQYRSYH